VLEPVSRAPVPESELLQKLEAFAGAQDAVESCADAVCWPTARTEF